MFFESRAFFSHLLPFLSLNYPWISIPRKTKETLLSLAEQVTNEHSLVLKIKTEIKQKAKVLPQGEIQSSHLAQDHEALYITPHYIHISRWNSDSVHESHITFSIRLVMAEVLCNGHIVIFFTSFQIPEKLLIVHIITYKKCGPGVPGWLSQLHVCLKLRL